MLQIIGLLLCVYLVAKGVEILQIGLSSPREDKWHVILGWLSFGACFILAVLFAIWLLSAGAKV